MHTTVLTPPRRVGHETVAVPSVRYSILVVQKNDLAEHVAAWDELTRHVREPNMFYEPWMLLPAIRALGGAVDLRFVLVFAHDSDESQLVGFFPFQCRNRYRDRVLPTWQTWQHIHCFLGTPLVRTGHEHDCLQALFAGLRREKDGPALVKFTGLADGPFPEHVQTIVPATLELESYQRAFLRTPADAEHYIKETLSNGNRKELRRQRRRLNDMGDLQTDVLEEEYQFDTWLDEFLQLEARSWKGQEGTAIRQSAAERGFFEDVCREAFSRGQLMMLRLGFPDKALAVKCNFLAGAGSFAFKIAYDEAFYKYSPGVQLELDNIRHVSSCPDVDWMDSCAKADHFMINRLWKERRGMRSLLVPVRGVSGRVAVTMWPWLRQLRRSLRKPTKH